MGQLEETVRAEEAKAESKKVSLTCTEMVSANQNPPTYQRPRTNSTVGRATTPALGLHTNNRKVSSALSVTPSLRSASGSSHASTAFSMSTTSSASSVLGPASKRQKLNNANPHATRATPNPTSSTAIGSVASIRSVPMRPPSRQAASRIAGSTGRSSPFEVGVTAGAGAGKVRIDD